MTPRRRRSLCLALALTTAITLTLAATAALAGSGKAAQGAAYVSGGVTDGELLALHRERANYSLWVVTVAKSGAHLADVRVVGRDAPGAVVFDLALDGPWLLIDLPRGRYTLEASLDGEVHKAVVVLGNGQQKPRQQFFRFNTGDQVGTDYKSPFDKSPYSAGR